MRSALLALLVTFSLAIAAAPPASAASCGEVVTIATHDGTTTRYALAGPPPGRAAGGALVLLPGGGGVLDLDDAGCPRALTGNSLVRSLPLFHGAGFVTVLVDAPSDQRGDDGLGGFRIDPRHAEDLGKVIADVRGRTKGPVWVVGTSRGSISAVNAASRLSGAAAPDGLVITSPVTSGHRGGRKAWVAQTVFDPPLEDIRIPVLVVGHAEDRCIRTPPDRLESIAARTESAREQVVVITGGPGGSGAPSVNACEGRSPHGFVEQEADVVAVIDRFVRGGGN